MDGVYLPHLGDGTHYVGWSVDIDARVAVHGAACLTALTRREQSRVGRARICGNLRLAEQLPILSRGPEPTPPGPRPAVANCEAAPRRLSGTDALGVAPILGGFGSRYSSVLG
jgi:hypothetical protein